jgi:hypothetical protein
MSFFNDNRYKVVMILTGNIKKDIQMIIVLAVTIMYASKNQ